MKQLTVGNIISNAFSLGLKNIVSLVGAVLLWAVTFWIPYLNVGTTIGLIGIVVAMSKKNAFSPGEIFNAKYRKYMGEFFLLLAFLSFGVIAGYAFLVIPGIVISIAWGQAIYLLLDKGLSPIECIKVSNKITYGKKWTIFWAFFLLTLLLYIILAVIAYLQYSILAIGAILPFVLFIIVYVAFISIMIGASATIYGTLRKKIR